MSPTDARVLWEYYDKKFPIDLDFQDNTIQMLFADEMKTLKFLALY